MKGIRKRVLVSFLGVAALLFFAGLVSLLELRRVSSDTEEILRASERNLGLAKDMLDAAARQNKAVVHSIVFRQHDADSALTASIAEMTRTLEIVRKEAVEQAYLDTLSASAMQVQRLTQEYLELRAQREPAPADAAKTALPAGDAKPAEAEAAEQPGKTDSLAPRTAAMDFDGARWYADFYSKAYDKLTGSIRDYMISTQSSLAPRTEQLKRNAYRAVTPVLISLLVMIAIVLMLYYFISVYLVRPVLAMNKSLGDSLRFGLPFKVKVEVTDEVAELKDRIDDAVQLAKKAKQEQR